MPTHFQNGWVRKKRRKKGEVWYFEFRDYSNGGKIRPVLIGPVSKYKTESDALRAVELKRMDINQGTDLPPSPLMTAGLLTAHYLRHELNSAADAERSKASSTKDGYEDYIVNHILPRWRDVLLSQMKPIAIEEWLRSLTRMNGKPMARASKAKIRNIMGAIFKHGMRYDLTDRNPVALVRQSSKRSDIPDVLTVEEFRRLLAHLGLRENAMVLLAAGTGLRRAELFALKWSDVNDDQMNVTRSIFHNTKRERIGACKTEASRKPVPLDAITAARLSEWHATTTFNQTDDWIFASTHNNGKWPFWPQTVLERFIRPAAKRAGIAKRIGWHTFRRSYCTLLSDLGTDVKVMQELMRHANIQTTMNVYAQAMMPAKREAQAKVVQRFVN